MSALRCALPVTIAVLLAACAPADVQATGRMDTRAYDGAPPTIPHSVEELGRGNCQACHTSGHVEWEGKRAPRTPHPEHVRCTQCHLEPLTDELFRPNTFVGEAWATGQRQHPAAPWLIPHPLTMRENCLACHGEHAIEPVPASTHPERARCTQCHLPVAESAPGPRPGVPTGGSP